MCKYFIFFLAIVFITTSEDNLSTNIALNKPAMSSTVYSVGKSHPRYAVDGNLGSNFQDNDCFSTDTGDYNPWWLVDLVESYLIHTVALTNRDAYSARLHYFVIEISEKNPNKCLSEKPTVCYNNTGGALLASETRNFACEKPTRGRFVRIRNWLSVQHLTLCEVQIFGERDNVCEIPRRFNRVKQTRLISDNSEISTTPITKCPLVCMSNVKCLAFNFNTKTEQCELIFFTGDTNRSTDWDYYGNDSC